MPCPCCNHTVHNLGLDQAGRRVFWCPRCGTLKTESTTFEEHQIPRWSRLLKAWDIEDLHKEVASSHP